MGWPVLALHMRTGPLNAAEANNRPSGDQASSAMLSRPWNKVDRSWPVNASQRRMLPSYDAVAICCPSVTTQYVVRHPWTPRGHLCPYRWQCHVPGSDTLHLVGDTRPIG